MKLIFSYLLFTLIIVFLFLFLNSSHTRVKRTILKITEDDRNFEIVNFKQQDFILLNDEVWFSSKDYYRFSEVMVNPAILAFPKYEIVCVLDDPTGVIVEECLRYKHIKKIYVTGNSHLFSQIIHNRGIADLSGFMRSDKRIIKKNSLKDVFEETNNIDILFVNEKWNSMKKTIFEMNHYKNFSKVKCIVLNCFSGFFDIEKYRDILQIIERNYSMCYHQVSISSVCDNVFAIGYKETPVKQKINFEFLKEFRYLSKKSLREISLIDSELKENLKKMNVYHFQGGLF